MTRSNKRINKKVADLGYDRNIPFQPRKVEGWRAGNRVTKNCALAGEYNRNDDALVMVVRPVMTGKYFPNGDRIALDQQGQARRIKRVPYERAAQKS